MRRTLVVLGLAVVLGGFVAVPAHAQSTQATGPLCFSTAPFPDILVWFITADGATTNSVFFDGNGKDILGNRPQNVSLLLDTTGTTLRFGYTTYPGPGFVPVFAGGTLNTATLSGTGQCFAPDLASCGDFNMQLITCPTTASVSSAGGQGARD